MDQANTDIAVDEVLRAARRPEVVRAMRGFFAETDRLIAEQPATCWNRAACCQFGQFGHRLYVTALEVCYYLSQGGPPPPITADACPHARAGQCNARDRRPLGCRVFYCDANARAWQGPLTEERLARLRSLHDELSVQYFYADWMVVLRALGEQSGNEHVEPGRA